MSNVAELIGVSQDFVTSLSPNTSLRKWLKDALADDDLALFFMYSEPPSETECKYGVQLIDPASLPIAPNAYYAYYGKGPTDGRRHMGNTFMGFTDATPLLSTEWLEDVEKLNLLNGTSYPRNERSTMTLVPNADVRLHKTKMRRENGYTRVGTWVYQANDVSPFKWAVLARKSGFNPRLRSWFGDGESAFRNGTNYPADYLLFDFRGGIPLTVGAFGSEANVWLGAQYTVDEAHRGETYVYPDAVEIGRINIPKMGV
ncbi:MAG: hypothetical protein GY833_22825 [Aestuariibacter sp.]|nr:hypothetical protein [Aestuariibacter sp.]